MSDTPEGAAGPAGTPGDATGGAGGAPGAGVPPPAGDAWSETRRRIDEARERARAASEAARQARAEARQAVRDARAAAREASRESVLDSGVVIGRNLGSGGPVTPRIVFGMLFILFGVLWTLDNFGLVESGRVMSWLPMLLVVYGGLKLAGVGVRRNPLWGGIWVVLGTLMLFDNLGLIRFSLGQLWPLALVALGFMFIRRGGAAGPILIGGRIGRRGTDLGSAPLGGREGVHIAAGDVRIADDPSDRIEMFSVWSHVDRRVVSQSFRRAEVGAVMGGIRLDLRGAKSVPEGAVIDLAVVWGGVDIVVPPGWQVVNEATVLIGGITDSTLPGSSASGDRLILRGAVVMGGVELKSN
jgi:hypothetical protein